MILLTSAGEMCCRLELLFRDSYSWDGFIRVKKRTGGRYVCSEILRDPHRRRSYAQTILYI